MPEYSEEQKRREEHREAARMGNGSFSYDRLLAYFDEYEPKLALAIREGIPKSVPEDVIRYGLKRMFVADIIETGAVARVIDYPEGAEQ